MHETFAGAPGKRKSLLAILLKLKCTDPLKGLGIELSVSVSSDEGVKDIFNFTEFN